MAENIVISVVAKIAEYTVAPVGRWLCYSFHFNSNIENLKTQAEHLREAKDMVQHSVDVAVRNEEEIYPVVSTWLTDVDRITELATRRLRESEEEAGTRSSNAACLNLKQRHRLSREAKKIVESIAQLFANGKFGKVSNPTLPSEEMVYKGNIENLKNQEEELQHARERVQLSVVAASRNGEEIYSDVSKWLTDVDRITVLATKILRESEEEASTRSSNAAGLNLQQRHQLSREAKKIVENIAQLFTRLHNNGNFEKVSIPTLPSEEMDYRSNIENLKNQEEELQHARERVRPSVVAALRNGEEIYSDVSKWLTDVDRITESATKILRESEEEARTRSSNAAGLNLQQRHELSREAKKIVENIVQLFAKLRNNGNFEKVSKPPTLQNMVPKQSKDYMILGSRMSVIKRIMEALRDGSFNRIGVSGLAGVGKSTLMKEICRQVKEKRLFDEVALAEVTNSPNLCRIQGEIASMLNLQFDSNETKSKRADRLEKRLKNGNEILVILDDIWMELDLKEIGIPSGGCKLLLTSRDQRVLASRMDTEKNFKLDILGVEEAWTLFEKMAGVSFKDDPRLQNEAIKVAKECAGLPIALVTVSKALKDHKDLSIWKDALVQLRRPPPEHDTEIWLPVYSCIKLSYKHLVGEEIKSLFLLCAQQGYVISYQDLLRYGFGLRLFPGAYTMEDASNRLKGLVLKLQDSCLLIQSPHSSKEFYMHDVVRHVATMIASNDRNMFVMRGNGGQTTWAFGDALKTCEVLSIHGAHHIHKYPNKVECPKLRYFHVQCKDSYLNSYLKWPIEDIIFQGMNMLEDIIFQGMDKLEVLSLTKIRLSSLWPLTKLQTLCLHECELMDIHVIGELNTLVILSLARSSISNLPSEIRLLTSLRLLDLTYCVRLKVIPPNVLSSLVNLEELYMQGIKVQWEVEGPRNEGQNASLAELKKLSHLTTLEMDISDANYIPKDLFTEKFERYKICIGDIKPWDTLFTVEAISRALKFKNMSFQLDFEIKMLLKRTEYLHLDSSNCTKSVLYELNRENFQKLKHLHIQINGDIKRILELRTPAVAFPILETFVLKDMFSLEEICRGKLLLSSFKNLKVLKVVNCDKLRFIFSSSIVRGLSLLEELNITSCNNMGAIFVKEEEDGIEDHGDMMVFGRLQTLVLNDLPKLVGFLSTKDSLMADCRETNSEGNHDLQLPLLHHDQVSFPSLQTLCMWGLPKIKYVWSCGQEPKTVFSGLEQLQVLEIEDCGVEEIVAFERGGEAVAIIEIEDCGGEEIVAFERGGEAVAIRTLMFPQVTKLKFRNLLKLKWFYKGVHVSKWPMLKEMKIERCEKVEIFASEVVSFEKTVKDQRQFEMSNIKQPLFSVDEDSFPSLETLWISDCQELFHVFPTAILMRSLTDLRIQFCSSLEIIFGKLDGQNGKEPQVLISPGSRTEESGAITNFASTVSFPSLQTLHMKYLRKIKHIWSEYSKTVFNFQSLQNINACRCESLKSLFPISIIRCLEQLQVLEIENCGVEEIVAVEGGGGEAIRTLVFPQVTQLKFSDLPRLKWFCQGVYVTKWPMLKKMKIVRCEKVEIFASEVVSFEKTVKDQRQFEMSNIKQPLFLVNEHSFPSLETLEFLYMGSLEIIFGKLEGQNGKEPQVLISPASGTEESGATTHFASTVSFPSLQTLCMKDLPKLKHVWSYDQEPKTVFNFQNLQNINAWRCKSLKSLFPISVINCLKQLQLLEIEDCGVEEIVVVERGGEAVAIRTLVFPQVTQLKFSYLGRLKWFCKGVYVSKWPMLKEMTIDGCDKVEIFASEVVSFEKTVKDQRQFEMSNIKQPIFLVNEHSFPSLETLEISNMDSLEIIFGKLEGQNGIEPQVLISPESRTEESGAITNFASTVAFPSLQTLRMKDLHKLKHVWSEYSKTVFNFQNLEVIQAVRCESLKSLFPISIIRCLEQLQVLEIENCGVEEIVAVERGGGGGEAIRTLVFPQVTQLKFSDLSRLKWFCQGVYVTKWPMLKEMTIDGCDKVEIFASEVVSFEKTVKDQRQFEMSNIKQPLFLVNEHSFPSLETLEFWDMDSLEIIFVKLEGQNGKEPQVLISPASGTEESGATTHFVSTHSFPSLETLEFWDMDSLEIIFGKLEGQNGKEPQVLISPESGTEESGAITNFASTVAFPSLQTLRMKDLHKLKHVWSEYSKTVFNFQNLEVIQAVRCESLKSLFPISIIRCLEQLQVLEIENCGVEEIVAVERGGGGGEAIRTLVFPQVTQLKFSDLSRLKWFCQGVYVTKWPMLKEMTIDGCDKVEIFASEVVSFEKTVKDQRQFEMSNIKQPLFLVNEHSFPSLETLEFLNMGSLEIIFGMLEGQNGKEPQVLISPASGTEESGATTHFASTLSFPSLKKLHIRWMCKLEIIWQDQVTATSFPNIQELDILSCDKLLHVFQSKLHTTTTTLMQSLTSLRIWCCDSLETIFGNMEGQNGKEPLVLIAPSSGTEESVAREDGIARYIEFPILTELSLYGLPKLKWIFEGVHTNLKSWPSLKTLFLEECGEQVNKMIWASNFASSSSSQENQLHTWIQQPTFQSRSLKYTKANSSI
ncbi:uncharacterized protein LOC122318833 isoform X2 [Carya illinoinensis]|uniref:uncharacterized protein LOC122318833 isoform X2 n=1 Tax=Carya illinoinensis TaxID=32201 RepID=UPI001C7292D9|nr:uncharacterized protein LOC122318833 isoform X2 [Carya illinoinensis]